MCSSDLALIAFAVTARRPFSLSWTVSAVVAGLLGLLGTVLWQFSYTEDALFGYVNLGLIWPVPLFILGIAMCRTRVAAASSN